MNKKTVNLKESDKGRSLVLQCERIDEVRQRAGEVDEPGEPSEINSLITSDIDHIYKKEQFGSLKVDKSKDVSSIPLEKEPNIDSMTKESIITDRRHDFNKNVFIGSDGIEKLNTCIMVANGNKERYEDIESKAEIKQDGERIEFTESHLESMKPVGWDMRSILDYPLGESPSAVLDIDDAWDTSAVSFAMVVQQLPTTQEDKLNVFISSDWSPDSYDFQQDSEIINHGVSTCSAVPTPLQSMERMHKRENPHSKKGEMNRVRIEEVSNLFYETMEGGETKQGRENIQSSMISTVGWPSTLCEEDGAKLYCLRGEANTEDDDALLKDFEQRSDSICYSNAESKEVVQCNQHERMILYESQDSDRSNSFDDDEEMESEDESDFLLQYVPHDTSDLDKTTIAVANTTQKNEITPKHLVYFAEEAVLLAVANSAAEISELHNNSSKQLIKSLPLPAAVHEINEEIENNSLPVENNDSKVNARPQPTNELEQKTLKSTNNESSTEQFFIPLIAPPPEEKLRKWQDRKLCNSFLSKSAINKEGKKNDASTIIDNVASGIAAKKLGDFSLSNLDLPSNSSSKYSNLKMTDEISLPNSKLNESNNKIFSESWSSHDKSKAINRNSLLSDDKITEKVAVANSTAAKIIEEKLSIPYVAHSKSSSQSYLHPYLEEQYISSIFCGGAEPLQNEPFEFTRESFQSSDPMSTTEKSFVIGNAFHNEKSRTTIMQTTRNSSTLNLQNDFDSDRKHYSFNNISEEVEGSLPNSEVCEKLNHIRNISSELGACSHISSKKEGEKQGFNDPYANSRLLKSEFLVTWLKCILLQSEISDEKFDNANTQLRELLDNDKHFDKLCAHLSAKVNSVIESNSSKNEILPSSATKVKEIIPFSLAKTTQRPEFLAANFISFLQRIGNLTGIEPPFKDDNPFISLITSEAFTGNEADKPQQNMQQLVFSHPGSDVRTVAFFFYHVIQATTRMHDKGKVSKELFTSYTNKKNQARKKKRYLCMPNESPSPFETATWTFPVAIVIVLGMLGDPVAVCRMKMINRFCNRVITENEHMIMRDAVRLGGISMNVRPAFWMWLTIENCGKAVKKSADLLLIDPIDTCIDSSNESPLSLLELNSLALRGVEGKWHAVIERDVARAFGNMPPHKTGARLRADSIVRALVTFGRGRLLKRGVKGGGEAFPIPSLASPYGQKSKFKHRESTAPPPWEIEEENDSDLSKSPTDTVSDWGGVSPVPSFNSSVGEDGELKKQQSHHSLRILESLTEEQVEIRHLEGHKDDISSTHQSINSGQVSMDTPRDAVEELALSGNTLSNEMKVELQNQLSTILHALAALHDDVGYCQGMDYVVAHLLRVLQDTVKWRATRCSSSTSLTTEINLSSLTKLSVFQVMDCFFTTYNLRHMYYPELRSLKICCRVFEKLIKIKLPVLADHFEHHELNVGLFALGWFQTLFLYLPSMPTATVCHMWDIWLVERSFKIFFRVGTAILFLSQPILLNHELEGMMTYLNTFPDATLLKADILIACALQIKVTNRMLAELEMEVTGGV